MALDKIRIVLVRPTHPGNVGAVARAMKTMSLRQLWLVAPERYPDPEADARAAGAEDVLRQAHICQSLDDAISDCHMVVGTSARSRHIEWPVLSPTACAAQLVSAAERGRVALLFGRERTGLTNAELDRCQALVQIPANPEYSSLNIASAVQILAYEVYGAMQRGVSPAAQANALPATRAEMQHLFRHLERVLVEVGFLDPTNPRLLMRRLTRLFSRANPDQNEINILRGILTAVQRNIKNVDKTTKQ